MRSRDFRKPKTITCYTKQIRQRLNSPDEAVGGVQLVATTADPGCIQAQLRRQYAAQERAERAHKKKLHDSFADYRKTLAPLLEALDALPARKGEKFMVRMEQHLRTDRDTNKDMRSLSIWIAYARPVGAPERKKSPDIVTDSLPMPRNGVNGGLDVYPEKNGRDLLGIRLETSRTGEQTIRGGNAHFLSYYDKLATMEDIPAYIGKWVAKNAPERLNDLRKVLGVKPPVRKTPAPR